jgi:hypothetical protein
MPPSIFGLFHDDCANLIPTNANGYNNVCGHPCTLKKPGEPHNCKKTYVIEGLSSWTNKAPIELQSKLTHLYTTYSKELLIELETRLYLVIFKP